MCNSCYNYRNGCCTSSTSGYCGARKCPKINYCYPRVENPNKCACCQQLRCKNNDLLHQLCAVPGTRAETMRKILLAEPPSKSSSTRMSKQTIPLLNYLGGDLSSQRFYEYNGNQLDVKLKKRFLLKYLGDDTSSQSHYSQNDNQLDVNLKQRSLLKYLGADPSSQNLYAYNGNQLDDNLKQRLLLKYLGADPSCQNLYAHNGNQLDVNLNQRLLLKYLGADPSSQNLYAHNGNQLDVNLNQRLLERLLKTNTEAQLKMRAVAKKKQLRDMVEKMKNWYIKEMAESPGEPELGVYVIPGLPSGYHPQLSRSKSLTKSSFIKPSGSRPAMRSFIAGFAGEDEVFVSNTSSDISLSSHMSVISLNVKPDMLPNPLAIDEKVALADIRELLKEVQKKPTRPILFHSPFQRDMPWSWRNYDPLSDMPSTLKASTSQHKSQYSPWTMNVVQELLTGNAVTDKKLKTNKELQGLVNKLAFEIKQRKELSYTKLRHPHHQRVHNRKRSSR